MRKTTIIAILAVMAMLATPLMTTTMMAEDLGDDETQIGVVYGRLHAMDQNGNEVCIGVVYGRLVQNQAGERKLLGGAYPADAVEMFSEQEMAAIGWGGSYPADAVEAFGALGDDAYRIAVGDLGGLARDDTGVEPDLGVVYGRLHMMNQNGEMECLGVVYGRLHVKDQNGELVMLGGAYPADAVEILSDGVPDENDVDIDNDGVRNEADEDGIAGNIKTMNQYGESMTSYDMGWWGKCNGYVWAVNPLDTNPGSLHIILTIVGPNGETLGAGLPFYTVIAE